MQTKTTCLADTWTKEELKGRINAICSRVGAQPLSDKDRTWSELRKIYENACSFSAQAAS